MCRQARLGLLANRAGVEDDQVGILESRRLPEAQLLEHALDPLRVVSVHLTAEGRDVVAAQGSSVATRAHEEAARIAAACRAPSIGEVESLLAAAHELLQKNTESVEYGGTTWRYSVPSRSTYPH